MLFRAGCFLILLFTSTAYGDSSGFWMSDLGAARSRALELNRPILLHFGATWCAPCQKMEHTVLNQTSVLNQLRASVVGVKIDIDQQSDLARRFNVETFPTDIILEPNGERLLVTTGMHSATEYLALVDRAGTRYADLLAMRNQKATPPVTTTPDRGGDQTQVVNATPAALQMDGYCPVTLWKNRRWEQGSPQYAVQYKGQKFHLASQDLVAEFEENPERYVPRFLGCDPVIVWETDRAVPGSTRFAAFYDEELFLFVSAENRTKFKAEPDRFIRTRVVLHLEQIETTVVR